ncbi:unnamed protein product [Kluyveromyces dobzhanskii CBS 2104]|uniref:WGS project CCBQ000000000 data, contig 00272 n=1 Tax=Kluyveromyces dobzhanskii CBS 2104 TaxID=1427455 RepID=A0A0A8L8J5_9SACH|nr:unnamed protein product [Kluyveromyces dobzhanskii CBS 2104]
MLSTRVASRSAKYALKNIACINGANRFLRTKASPSAQGKLSESRVRFNKTTKASLLTGASSLTLFLSYFLFDNDKDGVSVKEVKKHNRIDDCWIVIDNEVYDITKFLTIHPGGVARLMEFAGNDATEKFHQMHSSATLEKMKEHLVYIGKLKGAFENELTEEEISILQHKATIPPLRKIFCLSDFEAVAKQVLPKSTFFYYATGSSDEYTLRENHYAYSRVFFRPKILQDINEVDTSTKFMGAKVDLPIYITAFAGSRLAHPLGELNLQAASYDANVMQMVPKQNSYSFEEFFSNVPDDQNQWMQYHFDTQEELDNLDSWVEKSSALPSAKGLFFNVDLADIGNREKDSRQRASQPGSEYLNEMTDNQFGSHPKITWSTIERIIKNTHLPVALKGVQRGEDVVIAAEKGVSAVILSNHGGRQLDFSRPPLEVLVEAKQMLREKDLDGKIEIYLDGGVRRGSDILKALCLGATGVGMGRPFLYAMSGYGEEGVTHLFNILRTEIENNMRLLGVDKIEDLNESLVDARSLSLKNPRINDALYDQAYEPMQFPEFK